jgi:hypothetical protein
VTARRGDPVSGEIRVPKLRQVENGTGLWKFILWIVHQASLCFYEELLTIG